jgi:hypothetical protein
MSPSQQRFMTAAETRLSILFRDAADLHLQLYELKKLRYRVRQAERLARSPRPRRAPSMIRFRARHLKT